MRRIFTVTMDLFIASKGVHALLLDGEAPVMEYEHIKYGGQVYPAIYAHDAPWCIGLKAEPTLPESLKGEQIEFVG